MKGEYDDLLSWPFRQRVTFSLIAPGKPENNKTETFVVSNKSNFQSQTTLQQL